ncbi:MAG: BA14K family protein [Bradyrhizobium sp.]|uniref:BA14K family protein n=1 Tax=Bradyrhizobium sp. TaxID=376 RepID=UPI0029BB5167|nr:BA14K family protein [Bradyrhizobium sp.]MDX3972042.1 BA14K family protein [Bradyrhizobium sp.]
MNSLKILSAAAAVALVLPFATPSFAQRPGVGGGGGGGPHIGGGGGAGARVGGGGAAFRGGGGNFAAGAAMRPSGGNFAARTAMRPSGGSFVAGATPRQSLSPSFSGTRGVATAGNWHGGSNWSGRHGYRHRRGGFWPGFATGVAVGGLGSYAYYGSGYGYYDDPYYYGSYYDEPSVAVVQDGGDSAAYCAQRFKSYDPASGTYLGYDGRRHPCP